MALIDKVEEEGPDFRGTHLSRMTLVVEKDEAARPIHVGFFGAVGVMLEAQDIPQLVEEFLFGRGGHGRSW